MDHKNLMARSFDPYDKTGEAISLAMHKPVG